MEELCQRCGESGNDRRTLWMACLYDMTELDIPFKERAIQGVYQEKVGEYPIMVGGVRASRGAKFEALPDAQTKTFPFFTLKVCKDCRADWMEAIRTWFKSQPAVRCATGTEVYLRRYGATYEATPEEVEELKRKTRSTPSPE